MKVMTNKEFVRLLENILKPFMKPLYNLPGVAALGAVLTFLSDNPAIISLANDKNFSQYFKKYQLISLTNFGTAFGMGLVVIAFMTGKGYASGAMIGLLGAVIGSVISTRIMQRSIIKAYPNFKEEEAAGGDEQAISFKSDEGAFLRGLNAILDGGKTGVELGLAIIPGVLIISTFVMILTFGAPADGIYTGAAYEGIGLLPKLGDLIAPVTGLMFGFKDPSNIAFPITSLGATGAAMALVPRMLETGAAGMNEIAVFTAMGMCWSGYLSTHISMMDALDRRQFIKDAIVSHTIGGLCAGVAAHYIFMLISMI